MVARAVLDASAIVAVLFKERGHEVVLKVIAAGAVTTPTGMAEALNTARRKGHRLSGDRIADHLGELGLEVEPILMEDGVDMARVQQIAAEAKERQPDVGALSLGDAACLAVGRRLGLPAIVSDGTWEVLDLAVKVVPFR